LLLNYIGLFRASRLAQASSAGLLIKLIWGAVAGAIGLAVYFILIILLRRIPDTGRENEKNPPSRFNRENMFDEKEFSSLPFYGKGKQAGLGLVYISSMVLFLSLTLMICAMYNSSFNLLVWSIPLNLFALIFYMICQFGVDKRKIVQDGKLWRLYIVIPLLIFTSVFGMLALLHLNLILWYSARVYILLWYPFLIPVIILRLWRRAFYKPRLDKARGIIMDAIESDPEHKDSYLEDIKVINERNKK